MMFSRFVSGTTRRLHAAAAAATLPEGLRPEAMPRHVALVPDGNRRWAQARGLPTSEGHEAGRLAMDHAVRLSRAWGIRALTVFAFSHDNLGRPKEETDHIMGILARMIRNNADQYARDGIRLHVLGDSSAWSDALRSAAGEGEEATRHGSRLHLMLTVCYGGRWEMVRACRELARRVQAGVIRPEDIDEPLLAGGLQTSAAAGAELACPDLLIRTSGELRLSNFLLWQCAYSELYFTDTLWPDFGEAEYLRALTSFQSRERRFGQRKTASHGN